MTVAITYPGASRAARDLLSRVVAAGLAGAAVDFIYASGAGAVRGRSFAQVWEGVAAGWLGGAAQDGGIATVSLGLVTHFGIATAMATAYIVFARRLRIVAQRPLATAPIYGLILYAVMYLVVLPLRWPEVFPRWRSPDSVFDVLAHVGVALAIAWVASRPAKVR